MFKIFNKHSNINIIVAGIISLFLGVGIARFSYTTILPEMLNQNIISLTFSGILASTNYIGYISGAFIAIFINSFNLKVKLFRLGLILSIATTFIFTLTQNESLWILGRIVAGFGSAMLLVVGPAIVVKLLHVKDITKTMGYYFTGIGFAIIFSELLARIVLPDWHGAWILLSCVGLVLVAYPYYILSFNKHDKTNSKKNKFDTKIFTPFVFILIFAYGTEGFGFVIQGTFLPTIISSLPHLESFASNAWLLVGIAGVPSAIFWMRLASKYGSIKIITIAMSFQIIGILIPTLSNEIFPNLLSGFIYGFTFVPLVALFINLGGKISKDNPVLLMGAFTSAYGIGQISAPLYAVYLTNISGNYNYALYLTAFIVFCGVLSLLYLQNRYKQSKLY